MPTPSLFCNECHTGFSPRQTSGMRGRRKVGLGVFVACALVGVAVATGVPADNRVIAIACFIALGVVLGTAIALTRPVMVLTCPECGSSKVIPARSPKAQKHLSQTEEP